MLLYFYSYLNGRTSKNIVNGYTADWITMHVGIPQVGVNSALIFITFISEMTCMFTSRIGFSDDLTVWVTHIEASFAS